MLSLMHSTPAWKRSFLKYKSAKGGTSLPLPRGEAQDENVLVTRHVGAEPIPWRRFHGKMSPACSLSYKQNNGAYEKKNAVSINSSW